VNESTENLVYVVNRGYIDMTPVDWAYITIGERRFILLLIGMMIVSSILLSALWGFGVICLEKWKHQQAFKDKKQRKNWQTRIYIAYKKNQRKKQKLKNY